MTRTDQRLKLLEEREAEVASLQCQVHTLQDQLSNQAQAALRNEIELVGIPETSSENLSQIATVLATKIGVVLNETDVDWVTRVGLKRAPGTGKSLPRPIVIRCVRRGKRDEILRAGKSRKNLTTQDLPIKADVQKIFINERLTSEKQCHLGVCSIIRSIPGYSSFYSRNINNQAGGVVVYIKEEWRVQVFEPDIEDADCLALTFPNHRTVLGIYRSPSFRNIDNFCNSLESYIVNNSRDSEVMLIGDLNVDILKNGDDVTKYLCLTASFGLKPAINVPTRGVACLDHIFLGSKVTGVGAVCKTSITDHEMVMVGISETPRISRRKRLVRKLNFEAFESDLNETDWSDVLSSGNATDAAEKYMKKLHVMTVKHTKLLKVSRSKYALNEWVTPGLIKCMRHRDALHLQAKKEPNNLIIQVTYKRYRNFLTDLLKKLKIQYNGKNLETNKNNPRKLWKTIKDICELKIQMKNSIDLLHIKNNPVESLSECNKYFSSIGQNLASKILKDINKSEQDLARAVSNVRGSAGSFFMTPTDTYEVRTIIGQLNLNSAPGLDSISTKMLRRACNFIIEPLTHIINLSLSSGQFPECWKSAAIIPIYKDGLQTDPSNYRPISLLSVFSKILERVVNLRLTKFLESQNVISHNQFGFRKGRSTEEAANFLIKTVTDAIDHRQKSLGIFLDLSKAFDTVSHYILLRKLEVIGIRGVTLRWFSSYLERRNQIVVVDEHKSNTSYISFGIPQGSILGPTLFSIYMNDLCHLFDDDNNVQVICYADDTAIICTQENWFSVFSAANSAMKIVSNWLGANLLTLNTAKSKYVCFHNTKASSPPTSLSLIIHKYSCDNNKICSCDFLDRVHEVKYLGLILDQKLTFASHIQVLSKRIRKLIHVMKLLRNGASKNVLLLVYKSIAQSLLMYCITVWGGASKSYMIALERAQRSVLKVMFRKPIRFPTYLLYQEAAVLTVRQLYILKVVMMHHKSPLLPQKPSDQRSTKDAGVVRSTTLYDALFVGLTDIIMRS
ncbi:uncharacterized protein LOC128201816 [Galleria mellonella]|uniref:Uncharacterized protein LOC128201816 n=1 Tax=Galleria mellonella TaxID=7137 RepID=A0ABM3MWZ2_GALME|nr:uncharacterized protein LOC128201816 [Galleria mellonella]